MSPFPFLIIGLGVLLIWLGFTGAYQNIIGWQS